MPLLVELEGPDSEESAPGEGAEAKETTSAQRTAGKALISAIKRGDGEAVYLAFAELHAICCDEEEGEEMPESSRESGEY